MTEHSIADIANGRLKLSSKRNLIQSHTEHHKSHVDYPGTKPGPLQQEACD
jgi:hypothetical protein